MISATAEPIDTAMPGAGWILGHVPGRDTYGRSNWLPLSMGDDGWMDEEGEVCTPTLWVALPDPQPAPTGWTPPEGVIHIDQISGDGWTCNGKPIEVPYRWAVYILRLDGSYDEYRETQHYVTYAEAEKLASKWQQKMGLSIAVSFLDSKVVPFAPRGRLQ